MSYSQTDLSLAIKHVVRQFANEMVDSLDSRIYWARENNDREVAAALEDVRDAVHSACEEALS